LHGRVEGELRVAVQLVPSRSTEAEAELVGAAAFVDEATPLPELADILVKAAEA
jgi:hypothetical protein